MMLVQCFLENIYITLKVHTKVTQVHATLLFIQDQRAFKSDIFLGYIDCVKSVPIPSFSCPHFPAFGLNIQYECGKMRTRKTPTTDIFYALILLWM